MIWHIVNIYYKLPVRPFKGLATKLYCKYVSLTKKKNVIVVRNGIKYELDLNEGIDMAIYFQGCWERDVTSSINKFVERGMTVLDAGANIGAHTLRLAKLVGEDGKVIAFEPMSWAYAKLERNVSLNNFNNIVLEKCALSDVNLEGKLTYFQTSWHVGGVSAPNSKLAEPVNFITLDDYVRANNIDNIDFIKMDVGGYEYKVIQGGVESIRKFFPIMIMQTGNTPLERSGDRLENLIDLLSSIGYSFYLASNMKQYDDKESLLHAFPSVGTIFVLCKPRSILKPQNLES